MTENLSSLHGDPSILGVINGLRLKFVKPSIIIEKDLLREAPELLKLEPDSRYLYDFDPEVPTCTCDECDVDDSGVPSVHNIRNIEAGVGGWTGHLKIPFQDHELHLVGTFLTGDMGDRFLYALASPDSAVATAFLRHLQSIREERSRSEIKTKVFTDVDRGYTRPTTTWNDVILPAGIREKLDINIGAFFGAKETYTKLGIPYRRGILLVGPPGNGKTSTIKVLLSEYRQYAAFVFSFGKKENPFYQLTQMIRRAQKLSPSIVVLEDIDRVVEPDMLRGVLNLLDGITSTDGVMILGSSNEPEKLSEALIERPSRFDMVIDFPMPDPALRATYISHLFKGVSEITPAQLEELVLKTNKFSMAMLQEVRTGACLEAMKNGDPVSVEYVVRSLHRLSESLKTARAITKGEKTSTGFSLLNGR